jgi:hypothetical protein
VTLLLVHAAATWAMVGFIWTIQLLQYPLMAAVPEEAFVEFERRHRVRVSGVIAIFGLAEVVSAGWLVFEPGDVPGALAVSAGVVLASIWLATAGYFAPLHGRLLNGFDPRLHRRLVLANWLRTAAWSVRGVLALWMLTF